MRRAPLLFVLLVLAEVLTVGVAGVVEGRRAAERGGERAQSARVALEAALSRDALALRAAAAAVASSQDMERESLELVWPHLAVDLLVWRVGDSQLLLGPEAANLPDDIPAGPTVLAGVPPWLVVAERSPDGGATVAVGRRLDAAHIEALSDAAGAEVVLVVDGELAGQVEGSRIARHLLPGRRGIETIGGTDYSVRAMGDPATAYWLVAVPVVYEGAVPALALIALFAMGLGGVVLAWGSGTGREVGGSPERRRGVAPELVETRERLTVASDLNELYQRYLRRLAVELRTALTAVVGYSELLRDEAQRAEQWSATGDLDKVLMGARVALDLVSDTQALVDQEQGEPRLAPSAFQLDTLLHDVVSELRPRGASLGTRIELDDEDVGALSTDRGRLRQVLRCMIARALHAAPGGQVTVRAVREGAEPDVWIRVDVVDDGLSLTPAQLEQLFSLGPDVTSRGAGPGSSLGLLLASRHAGLLGGELVANSPHRGGTCVVLRLPSRLGASRTHRDRLEH